MLLTNSFHEFILVFMQSRDLKAEIVRRGIQQQDIARQLGIETSAFNLYLNGHRRSPPDLAPRVMAALDVLERAEAAANEARRRVLDEAGAA